MPPLALRALILAMLFAAIVLGIESAINLVRARSGRERTINRRLQMISKGQDRATIASTLRRDQETSRFNKDELVGRIALALIRRLHEASASISLRSLVVAMVSAFFVVLFLCTFLVRAGGYALSGGALLLLVTFSAAATVGLPLNILARMAQKRRKAMEEQFPVALDTFVRSLRAGHPVAAALDLLTTEIKDPMGSEFGLVVDEVSYGSELRDALQRMADRWQMNEIHMFVVSLSVQSETGGNLAEILENLSTVIRERQSLFMKVRALSSEGRMTAVVLTALPVLAFVGLFASNPSFYLDVAQDRMFVVGFGILISLYVTGYVTIRRMVDLKV